MTSMINERQLDSFLTMKFNGKDLPQQWFTRSEVKRVIKIALSAVKEYSASDIKELVYEKSV